MGKTRADSAPTVPPALTFTAAGLLAAAAVWLGSINSGTTAEKAPDTPEPNPIRLTTAPSRSLQDLNGSGPLWGERSTGMARDRLPTRTVLHTRGPVRWTAPTPDWVMSSPGAPLPARSNATTRSGPPPRPTRRRRPSGSSMKTAGSQLGGRMARPTPVGSS